MKYIKTLLGLSLLLLSVSCILVSEASANPSAKPKIKHAKMVATVTWPQTCPVTGEKIASAKDAVGSSVYKGKTFYFCCSMCKPQFDKNPAKFVDAAAKGQYLGAM